MDIRRWSAKTLMSFCVYRRYICVVCLVCADSASTAALANISSMEAAGGSGHPLQDEEKLRHQGQGAAVIR